MSESQVNAYFVTNAILEKGFSSGDPRALEKVLADKNGFLESFSSRFSRKTLREAVQDLVNGKEEENLPFHYSFALWIIVDGLAEKRPSNPHIPPPFLDLYDFNALLAKQEKYGNIAQIFLSLNNEIPNAFPHQLKQWGDMPGFAYLDYESLQKVEKEIKELKADFEQEKEWTLEIEEPGDIEKILGWLEEALSKKENVFLVLEGDL